ncbi:MAG: dethiobiotin synthase [Xanthomonadales bacterium]|nr:dethiobiotin synthase [Xanthomonadales bacterium]
MKRDGIYVTGTDTAVGKTVTSCALVARARRDGRRCAGFKPVASGCEQTPDGWRNSDALALQAAGEADIAYEDINPYALPLPQAPEIAAREAGVTLQLDVMLAAANRLSAQVDALVVEGVGGWDAPFAEDIEQRDLARALDLPVVLVIGLRLGCINHARLTARAIVADGFRLAGWIGNRVDPRFTAAEDNLAILRRHLDAPCLGVIPHALHADAAVNAQYLQWPDPRPGLLSR